MSSPSDEDRARSYSQPARRRRRYSVWTLLAPAAAIILWISFFSALGKSCVFKECADAAGTSASSEQADPRNELDRGSNTRVKEGDTLGSIAERFLLTEDELKACNPLVDPQTLQPGDLLVVSAIDCEDADKAETGANPDPLAGDTAAGANAAVNNGTAAADPSARKDAPKETAADQGDEG